MALPDILLAVGTGAAIIAAVVGSLHFGTVIVTARRRRERRERLGDFLLEGRSISLQCANEKEPVPSEEADDWAERAESYLDKHLGSDYVATFRDAAGLPMGLTSITSKPHRDLQSGIMIRLARLQQFLEELRQ